MCAPNSDSEDQAQCSFLPQSLWELVVQHALTAAADEGHTAILRQCAILLAVSHHVATAVHRVGLSLDLREAPTEDLYLLPPTLLAAVPLRCLLLAPRHASGAEALLRCADVAAASGHTLRQLAATVACTDTLQRYPALRELHLHAGAVERLYPAVLHGLPALAHLGLHSYQQLDLAQLPPSLAASLQVLEVTPRPEAMRCQLSLQLPPGARLRHFTVHGSFRRLLSSKAAPEVQADTLAVSSQCQAIHIEAQQVVWLLPGSCRGQEPEAALAGVLLRPGALWSRLELQLLEGACTELPPRVDMPGGGLPPMRTKLDLERLVEVMESMGGGRVMAQLQREECSIFHPWVLYVTWQDGEKGGGTC